MALTKVITQDRLEIVGDHKQLHIRTATIIKEDGVEISKTFHRRVLNPDDDVSGESQEIQDITKAIWTDDIKSSWEELNKE